ncbi:hypothetical protein [Kitasatospora sp. NPDC088134]|uniref:hypothetical protein n=1 Tax=Kitasatospora sp. NPDC088134 TaxID=3364071 RepID=UPI003802B80B
MTSVLRAAALLALAVLLLILVLPAPRRSRPVHALRSAVRHWLRPVEGPQSQLVRRGVGGAVAVVGIATFAMADSTSSAAAAYVLATAGILIYGT